jgi:K+-transporting ATPase ATPase C chain
MQLIEPTQASFRSLLRTSLGMLVAWTVLVGIVYPLLVTAVAHAAFGHRSRGSLVERNGRIVGSELIGQAFEDPGHFWSRLSATTPAPYNAGASTGSNLGPTNEAVTLAAKARIDALRAADPGNQAPIPVDLVTTSASGLDPHISPASAYYQVPRVAQARHLDEGTVGRLVDASIEPRLFGILGEPRVNVLLLNLALDELK